MIRTAQFEIDKVPGTHELVVSVLRQTAETLLFACQETGLSAGHGHRVLDFSLFDAKLEVLIVGRQL